MPPLSSIGSSARNRMLLVAALLALAIMLACLLPALAQTLQHEWAALHGVSDNLRGALAPDTGGKAACRSGLIRTFERTMPGARSLLVHSLAWLATSLNGEAGRSGAR